jgi:hypothetical protein
MQPMQAMAMAVRAVNMVRFMFASWLLLVSSEQLLMRLWARRFQKNHRGSSRLHNYSLLTANSSLLTIKYAHQRGA